MKHGKDEKEYEINKLKEELEANREELDKLRKTVKE